ncbi:MAG: SDR family NAD(P)-dependent oxidoreductase [Betaproteobacteria bacterium]
MSADLSGRIALITGASRGIGAATVRALRARGAEVVALSRHPFAQEADTDPGVHRYSADVGDWESVSAVLSRVLADHPVIDVLVNNAGMPGMRAPVWEWDVQAYRRAAMVNTFGPVYVMRLVMPGMVARADGVVINVVSGAADRPRPTRGMYGSQKAATEHLTRVVAQEAAEHRVRVHAFHPGPVDTALFASSRSEAELARLRAGAGDEPPLQAPAEPAAALAWLASPAGSAWTDVVVAWRDPRIRAALQARPDFAP